MIKKWFDTIFDHKTSLRERLYRIATAGCMIAAAFALPMGRSILNFVVLAASLVFMAAIVKFSIAKNCAECINKGATVIAVLILVLFPFSFFTAGGFYSGVPEWFVLCFYLYQHYSCGEEENRLFRSLHGGDAALLLYCL